MTILKTHVRRKISFVMVSFLCVTGSCVFAQRNFSGDLESMDSLIEITAGNGRVVEAIGLSKKFLALSQNMSYEKGEAAVYRELGKLHLTYGNLHDALSLLTISLQISLNSKDSLSIGKARNALGKLYYEIGDYAEAAQLHSSAYSHLRSNAALKASCAGDWSGALLELGSFEASERILDSVKFFQLRVSCSRTKRNVAFAFYENRAKQHAKANLFRTSIYYYYRALHFARLPEQIFRIHLGLAEAQMFLKNRNLSLAHLRKTKFYATYAPAHNVRERLQERLITFYHANSPYDKASDVFLTLQPSRSPFYLPADSLITAELSSVSEFIRRSDITRSAKIQDEMGLNRHRWQIFAIISFTFVLILLFGKFIDTANQKKQTLISQLGLLESKALKAQMNPHFIFNSLNSIQSLIASDNSSEAMVYVSKFSKLLRSVIENSNKNQITLHNELSNLKFYIELEALRLNFNLNYSIDVDPQIVAENELIPPLIVQPIVENALWHGLNGKEGIKELTVRVEADGRFLRFVVIDNGIGREAARQRYHQKSTGVGLANTERRISLLNENMATGSLCIEDLTSQEGIPLGTKVTFKIRRSA